MYFVTNRRMYLWMVVWLLLSTVLEAVRTGIGASILGLAFSICYIRKVSLYRI